MITTISNFLPIRVDVIFEFRYSERHSSLSSLKIVWMSLQIQLWIPAGRNVLNIFPYNSRSRNRLVGKSVSIFNGKCTGKASGNESRSISGYPLLVGKGWTQFQAVYPGIIGSAALPSSAKSFWRFKYHLKKTETILSMNVLYLPNVKPYKIHL